MDDTTLAALRQVAIAARALMEVAQRARAWGIWGDALRTLDAALTTYDAAQAAADAALASETVPEAWGCPQCGECRQDNLNWDANGEMVTCASCGEVYAIAEQPVASIPPAEINIDAEAQRDYLAMVGRGLGLHRAAYR